ncbi:hypothetical protein K523DRAFT_362662 [Schizophyllum commune Tattone D]|nr:hypothetical protein K523DRAFT_362662 [Schizophyllum commune Tattone D]
MIFAIDEALKTYKERVTELEMEKAMLEIKVKQERSSASALAKAARKETASLCKDLNTTGAEHTKAKEHVVDSTDIRNGLRKAARDPAISERDAAMREVAALREARGAVLFDVPRIGHEPCDGNLVERDALIESLRNHDADLRRGSLGRARAGRARTRREEGRVGTIRGGRFDTHVGDERLHGRSTVKESTPVALAEAIASESATYGSSGGLASLTTTEEISTDDTRATRQAAISTILGGAHRPDDMLSVTFSRVEVQNLGGDVKALRSALDVARTARMARICQDAPLRIALHDVASARADTHAAREEVKVWKREYAKWKVECGKREADASKWKEVLVKAHVKLAAEVEELKKLGLGIVSGLSATKASC